MGLNKKIIIRSLHGALAMCFCIFSIWSCKVSYSFSGASINYSQVKTFSVKYFQNRASLVQPTLSQALTDALIDKCRAGTNLDLATEMGDVSFEGEIVDYNTRPVTVGANAEAATNRFSITVHVKYTNNIQPEYSFDKQLSRYEDYSSNLDLAAVEAELSKKIIEMLVEDIFNQAFVNW